MPAACLDVTALTATHASSAALATAHRHIATAAAIIQQGGLVVLPTETFYGVAADPLRVAAVDRLVALKGRAQHKPFALIAANLQACRRIATMPAALQVLAEAFWPGPLTLLLPASQGLSAHLVGQDVRYGNGSSATVGVRVSSHPVAQALSDAVGGLITATSANLSGQPAAAVCAALSPQVWAGTDLVLQGGMLTGGQPSTIVRLHDGALHVVRPGAIALSALRQVLQRSMGEPADAC